MYVTATSVPSECLFSHVCLIATYLRNRLHHSNLEAMSFIKENMDHNVKKKRRLN